MDNVTEIAGKVKEEEKKQNAKAGAELFKRASVTLSKPFEWCGETYEQINMDFDGLTGSDMEAIDDELRAMNIQVPFPAHSRQYQRLLAARAAGVPSDMLEKLPLGDYYKIVRAAQNFLLFMA